MSQTKPLLTVTEPVSSMRKRVQETPPLPRACRAKAKLESYYTRSRSGQDVSFVLFSNMTGRI